MEKWIEQLSDSQMAEVHVLMQGEWWCSDRSLEEVHAVVAGSDLIIAHLDDDGNIAAFVRLLTDNIVKAVLFDVIVRPDFRDSGLGKKLIERTIAHPMLQSVQSIELYCPDKISGFYKRIGFSISDSKLHHLHRA